MSPLDTVGGRQSRCPLTSGETTKVGNSFRSRGETRCRARDAVDLETAKTVLSEAAEEDVEPDAEAGEALREAVAEETAEVAESTAGRARRRGRANTTSEDVAQAN